MALPKGVSRIPGMLDPRTGGMHVPGQYSYQDPKTKKVGTVKGEWGTFPKNKYGMTPSGGKFYPDSPKAAQVSAMKGKIKK